MAPSSDATDAQARHIALERKLGFERRPEGTVGNGAEGPAMETGGLFDVRAFSSGLLLSREALTAKRDLSVAGTMVRSLTIRLALTDDRPEVRSDMPGFKSSEIDNFTAFAASEAVELEACIKANQSFRTIGIQARAENLTDDKLAELVHKSCDDMAVIPMRYDPYLIARAQELFSPRMAGPVGELYAESFVLEVVGRTLDRLTSVRREEPLSAKDHSRLLRVRDRLVADPGGNHRLSDLARDSGMGVTQLQTKFALAFGQPLGAFLREVRMTRAYEGLKRDGWTAAQAAYFVGYQHPSSFSYAFRRRFGVSPRDIRNH